MNEFREPSFGTLFLPVCRSKLFDGLGECLESTKLGMTFEVVSWRGASGEDHCIVVVPHPDICRKSVIRVTSRMGMLRTYSTSWGFSGV
jgi:hypothetical protein